MRPEYSLSCSQEPATGPYPEPDESNPQFPILIQYGPQLFRVFSSLQIFRPKFCMRYS
jgi:hypothetical protein